VSILTVNRPEKRNALSSAVRREIIATLERIADDESVRVVVVTGAGGKAFVAGADVLEFSERSTSEQRDEMSGDSMFEVIAAYPKPTIAMINGLALGGGCELALACDVRVAGASARLGQPEINLGLIPGGGGTQRLPRLIGEGAAMRLVLSGELIDAEEAHRIGLVDIVVSDLELRGRVLDLAHRIAEKSPVALRAAKAAIRSASELPMRAGLDRERRLFLTCFGSDDAREGIAAFFEKRPPRFLGR
jgi:enoyl-CoA hydratase